ncbi:Phosphoglycerate mutase [Patulibacter medicamentivorans]|uniref:Phosphoglycerate mutase n=1 Tax=Patulibacter medicamentivorans TaxID=1097667 RepID=H0E656_9ACTN|nr:histidine phosphatase family protein [Patulibacter medicamentivorans]EHN10825.1 Phosphoglycerate mutase [Patulibacter medicamentivorans]
MPTLQLIRHGQASFGTADYDRLSTLGRWQANVTGRLLTTSNVRIVRVVAGGLQRQRQTAEPLVARLGLPLEVDRGWDEYAADDVLAAHSSAAVRLDDPSGVPARAFQGMIDAALASWIAAGDGTAAAESWNAFRRRTRAALDVAFSGTQSGDVVVCVSSGGTIAAVCAALLGAPDATFLPLSRVVVNGSITTIVRGRGGMSLVSFNEHRHLLRARPGLVTYR